MSEPRVDLDDRDGDMLWASYNSESEDDNAISSDELSEVNDIKGSQLGFECRFSGDSENGPILWGVPVLGQVLCSWASGKMVKSRNSVSSRSSVTSILMAISIH